MKTQVQNLTKATALVILLACPFRALSADYIRVGSFHIANIGCPGLIW